MTNEKTVPTTRLEMAVEWSLAYDVDHMRENLIRRSRTLAERLTQLADGLETDPDFTFNTIGVLQGNGVELDTLCTSLGYARKTLKLLREASAADARKEAAC